MKRKHHYLQVISILVLAFTILITPLFSSVTTASEENYENSFTKGVPWKPYISLKRTTFVQFDGTSLLDDYAYLAAVPTSVFYSKNNNTLFTSPLLFYQETDSTLSNDKRSMNAGVGIDYFMEDWMSYCEGKLDQITLINIPKDAFTKNITAQNITSIEGTDPYRISNSIALHDWSSSENVVIAPIEEQYEKPENSTQGTLTGTISPANGILSQHFEVPKTNQQYPIYNEFTVPDGYKFLTVRSWYPCFYISAGVPGFEGIINASIPAGDRDMQIYCDYNGQWMMAGITNEWNAQGGMDIEKTSVYVYKSGRWSIAITDVPTKSPYIGAQSDTSDQIVDTFIEPQTHHKLGPLRFGRYGMILEVLRNMRQVTYHVDINMYQGTMMEIPETPPYGCGEASFKVTWDDSSVALGLSLIGPSGEEVLSTREPGVSSTTTPAEADSSIIAYPEGTSNDISVKQLGECLPGEHYSLCVFAMNEFSTNVDFTIEYSWKQNTSQKQGDCLASATEGAVLASALNAPLLFIAPNITSQTTIDTLYTLGVKHIYLVNLGNYLTSNAKSALTSVAPIEQNFITYESIYTFIQELTGRNDVIFSTIDPWSYWYDTNLKIAGEMPYALPIGPAAFIAAEHGSPVLIIDNHPELSSAVVWHNQLWQRHPDGFTKLPTVSEMYLTGTRVYSFLKAHNFDREGEETIITVADQYEIGLSWDRMFVGKAQPGRFIGSPTDLSVWIMKNVFYPQLVFENPALKNPDGVTLINGSSSKRAGLLGFLTLWRGKLGLKITKPSQEETFTYPVLDTLICYDHKFNTRASTYWGFTYECADGSVPGTTSSVNPIDDGVMVAVNGKKGGFLPDLSGSEVQPFYLQRAGYNPVFSTSFDANMNNLNNGVLLWMINTHGASLNGGMLMFWDVNMENPNGGYPAVPLAGYHKELNPWRGYEWLMGSTAEPDTMTMEVHGIIPSLIGNPNPKVFRIFTTALDWALAKRPVRDILGNVASLPGLRILTPEWFQNTQDYYDGVIITVLLGRLGTSWYNGTQVDDALGNIHSTGISSVACLPAGKYLQLALMRHGSTFQIMDPWATSWYSDVWQNSFPRGIALGETIGEIYSSGIKKVGIEYISEPPRWWWDLAENVCLYGDPNLRVWVPSTEYSENNHWEKQDTEPFSYSSHERFIVDGHMPFGADKYPTARQPPLWAGEFFWISIGIIGIVILGLFVGMNHFIQKRKKEKK